MSDNKIKLLAVRNGSKVEIMCENLVQYMKKAHELLEQGFMVTHENSDYFELQNSIGQTAQIKKSDWKVNG